MHQGKGPFHHRTNNLHGKPASRSGGSQPTHWGNVAQWYDELVGAHGSEYHQHVVNPGVLRMLETRSEGTKEKHTKTTTPLRILDLACGQGVLCRLLANAGHEVVGVDAAQSLLDLAHERSLAEGHPVVYYQADATQLPLGQGPLQLNSFDVITCILAIQNMTPLTPIWKACRDLLKPAGKLILVMMHPCFRVPQHSDWHWNEKASQENQGRLITTYLSSTKIDIKTHPGQAAQSQREGAPVSTPSTTHFHRPLQAYINTLGSAGLLLEHMEEWTSHKKSQPGPRAAELDRSRKEIPLFLALRLRKV